MSSNGEDTRLMRAMKPAPTKEGRGSQIAGVLCVALLLWQGALPGLLALFGEPGVEAPEPWPWPWLAGVGVLAVVLLGAAEELGKAVRMLLPLLRGTRNGGGTK